VRAVQQRASRETREWHADICDIRMGGQTVKSKLNTHHLLWEAAGRQSSTTW